jgi:predicted  nucleic acid-binding Zn-ribbon protein
MNPDLPRVRELQQLDLQIRDLKQEIGRLPSYIAEIEQQLESHQQKLAADQGSLAENKKSHRMLEGEVTALEQKVSRLREQMNEAKTNDQYRAFQHEIEFVEDEVRRAEDRILDKMAEAETLSQGVKRAEEALAIEKKKVAQEVEQTRARVARDEQELIALEQQRKELTSALSPRVLKIYETIRKKRDGLAVATALTDRCLACNVVFRPQFSQDLRRNEEVLTCESCGRILFYEPPESQEVGSSTGNANAMSR